MIDIIYNIKLFFLYNTCRLSGIEVPQMLIIWFGTTIIQFFRLNAQSTIEAVIYVQETSSVQNEKLSISNALKRHKNTWSISQLLDVLTPIVLPALYAVLSLTGKHTNVTHMVLLKI